jgi:predicted lipoprotein with Yx(FWY)xxD motif
MKTLAIALLVVAAVAAPGANSADRGTLTVRASAYGPILFDGKGFVLYAFTADPRGRSVCKGECLKAWPAYLAAKPRPGDGAKASLLGTTSRADGKVQVTYGGRPLYYYVGDTTPGQILCQNVREYGGLWLVARGDGTLVR